MPISIVILKIIIFQIGVDIFSGGALHQGGGGHARAKEGRGAPFPIVIMIDITTKIMITTTVIHIITTKITTTGCVQSTFRLS